MGAAGSKRRRLVPGTILHSLVSPDSYGSVLVLLLVSYLLAVTIEDSWGKSLVLVVQVATVWQILRVSQARRSVRIIASIAFVLALVVAVTNLFAPHSQILEGIVFATASLLYLIAPLSLLRALVLRGQIDVETLFGAVDTYLLIGFFFAFTYRTIAQLQGGPFFGSAGEGSMPQDLFFSFTTLTTTGYGNLVPAANPGQSFAVLEMLIGQLFLVTAVAKIINVWTPKRRPGQHDDGAM
jgi:hypothetical protein